MSEFVSFFASAVILAAGEGKRAGNTTKQFALLRGKPVLAHSLETFRECECISEIIIAAPENKMEEAREIAGKWADGKAKVIAGGKTRFESARLGFYATSGNGEAVVFHDSARPFIDAETIEKCVLSATRCGAATAAIPLDDSIKITDGEKVKETLARKGVMRIQTPQAFRRDLLTEIYENFSGNPNDIGDETALFERTGNEAVIIAGNRRNMKITTSEDFVIAEAIAGSVENGRFADE